MNEINAAVGTTGLTLTATLMQGATSVATGIAMTEPAAGYYVGSVPGGTAAGVYAALIYNGAALVASGEIVWDGTAEVSLVDLAMRVRELYLVHGLDPGAPLVVSTNRRLAGAVDQRITETSTSTTVTRQ